MMFEALAIVGLILIAALGNAWSDKDWYEQHTKEVWTTLLVGISFILLWWLPVLWSTLLLYVGVVSAAIYYHLRKRDNDSI